MSIIRLSVLKDGVHAPNLAGTISEDTEGFRAGQGPDRRGIGNMGLLHNPALAGTSDPLSKYLDNSLKIEAANLPAQPGRNQPDGAPVVIMVHGWQFDPAMQVVRPPHHHKADNPHARLYHFEDHGQSLEMEHHSSSWPLGLGFARGDGGQKGLCIGFGWYSAPGFFSSLFNHGLNPYAKAYNFAEIAAWQLATTLEHVTRKLNRRVHIFCHSLGSAVVMQALAFMANPERLAGSNGRLDACLRRIDKVIVLAGAELVQQGQFTMMRLNNWAKDANVGAERPQIYNFVSRENDVLDKLGENFAPGWSGSKQVIGHNGLERLDQNWIDIQLDNPHVMQWFRNHPSDYTISGDNQSSIFAVLDHWIHFTWRDNMRVYHDILRDPGDWKVADLKRVNVPNAGEIFNRIRLMRGHVPSTID